MFIPLILLRNSAGNESSVAYSNTGTVNFREKGAWIIPYGGKSQRFYLGLCITFPDYHGSQLNENRAVAPSLLAMESEREGR